MGDGYKRFPRYLQRRDLWQDVTADLLPDLPRSVLGHVVMGGTFRPDAVQTALAAAAGIYCPGGPAEKYRTASPKHIITAEPTIMTDRL